MFYSADKGRLHLKITENLCQITVSKAMKKDNGRWNLYVGIGNDFFKRKNIIYDVTVSGNLNYINIWSASMTRISIVIVISCHFVVIELILYWHTFQRRWCNREIWIKRNIQPSNILYQRRHHQTSVWKHNDEASDFFNDQNIDSNHDFKPFINFSRK